MSKNVKKGLKPEELLVAVEAAGSLKEAKVTLAKPVSVNNMTDEVINMVVADMEALPEVALMAQLIAVEEETAKTVEAAKAKEENKIKLDKRITQLQRELMDIEINARSTIMNSSGIAMLRARFGDYLMKKVSEMVEQAKKLDENYLIKQSDLKHMMQMSLEAEKSIAALAKTGKAHVRTHTKIEKQLNALLKGDNHAS